MAKWRVVVREEAVRDAEYLVQAPSGDVELAIRRAEVRMDQRHHWESWRTIGNRFVVSVEQED